MKLTMKCRDCALRGVRHEVYESGLEEDVSFCMDNEIPIREQFLDNEDYCHMFEPKEKSEFDKLMEEL